MMNKKIFLVVLFFTVLSSFFCPLILFAGDDALIIKITPNDLKKIRTPENFATFVYGLVLGYNEIASADNLNIEDGLAKLTFTKDLSDKFVVIRAKDAKLKKIGCFDAGIFTSAQDTLNNFWVGKVESKANEALVPIFLSVPGGRAAPEKPIVALQLQKTSDGWRINDIIYQGADSTLRSQLQYCLAHAKEIY